MDLLENSKYLPYLCYRKKQFKGGPTEYYLFLVHELLRNKKHVVLRTKIIKYDFANKKKHVKK